MVICSVIFFATDTFQICLPASSTKNRIEQLAEATGRTKTFVIEEAINQYILRNEWQIQSIRKGQRDLEEGKVVPQEKMLEYWERKKMKYEFVV